ncbi:MAG TPA: HAMP domain-containing sensor histidine kinase [Candidatus Saccharimonadales bacterium]|nr:HAMP domain-containing sensor histidine kinase [Candidatus Saccharimonadales bacterium]
MRLWWQKHSRRTWLALLYATAGDVVLALCVAAAYGLGIWKPADHQSALLVLIGGGGVVTLLFIFIGYVIAGFALEPVRETIELARRLSAQSNGKQIPVTNPHDEIGELEIFLNELLQRLQGSFVELDRLAADASHELRTPLTAMRTVGEVALRDPNPAILFNAVGSMLEEVRRMNQMIDRLLMLMRNERDQIPVRPKKGSVRQVLLEVSETLGLVAEEKQQRLQVICPDQLLAIFDPALLRLALMNLTQNAIRYSPLGKPIIMRGEVVDNKAVIEIADEGPGIAPEHQQKVFQRFYRVDDARSRAEGGVGLGLAIVKWAVERMGGTVELQSQVGRGSIFYIRLPQAVA